MYNQSKTKKVKKIKPIKAWAIINNKVDDFWCCKFDGECRLEVFYSENSANFYGKNMKNDKIIPVLISPIKKINKK